MHRRPLGRGRKPPFQLSLHEGLPFPQVSMEVEHGVDAGMRTGWKPEDQPPAAAASPVARTAAMRSSWP